MNRILEILVLVWSCVTRDAQEPARFAAVAAIAVVTAGLFWAGCKYSMLLWNRRFRMRTFHHAVCCVAGLAGLSFILVFHGMRHLDEVAGQSVKQWADDLRADREWQEQVLARSIYDAIDAIDPQDTPQKNRERRQRWPMRDTRYCTLWSSGMVEADVQELSHATSKEVIGNFKNARPFLTRVLWPDESTAEDVAYARIQPEAMKSEYQYVKAFQIVSDLVTEDLEAKLPRVVLLSRTTLVAAFLLVQGLAYSIVGFTGYRDLRIRVAAMQTAIA